MIDGLWTLSGLGGVATRLLAQADPGAPAAAAAAAAAEGAQKAPGASVLFEQMLIFGGIFVVFWFLVLRPQSKRQKEHQAFLSRLEVGSEVVTASGIFGRITTLDEKVVELEIAPRVNVRVLRSQVAGAQAQAAEAVQRASGR